MQDIPLSFDYKGKLWKGFAVPLGRLAINEPTSFDIIIEKAFLGTLRWSSMGWKMDAPQDQQFVEKIGKFIMAWYARPIDSIA